VGATPQPATWPLPVPQRIGGRRFSSPLLLAGRDWPTALIVSANHARALPPGCSINIRVFRPKILVEEKETCCCSCLWGETMSLNCGHQHAYCSSSRWCMSTENHGWMILTGENQRTRRKTCPSATLSTTNPTWTDPGLCIYYQSDQIKEDGACNTGDIRKMHTKFNSENLKGRDY
jgi:hypothetical protein